MTTAERDELLIRIDERQQAMEQKLTAVHLQTLKTNGRVDKLEDNNLRAEGMWKMFVLIGTVAGVIIGFIIQYMKG